MTSNEVRIIGGSLKGRKLKFSPAPGLRPTLGRVRETLFNWLAADIAHACCLDLFAGSGALGFEALSRGAAEVVFVDSARRAASALRRNVKTLGARSASVHCAPAAQFLRRDPRRWDIVFFDPPFDLPEAQALLERVVIEHLKPSGLIYVEQPRHTTWEPACGWVKQATAGDCRFGLLGR